MMQKNVLFAEALNLNKMIDNKLFNKLIMKYLIIQAELQEFLIIIKDSCSKEQEQKIIDVSSKLYVVKN